MQENGQAQDVQDPNVQLDNGQAQNKQPGNNQDDGNQLDDRWLEIGRIVAPQGLQGEVRVYPESDFPERFLEPGDRWLWLPTANRPARPTPDADRSTAQRVQSRRAQSPEPRPVKLLAGRYIPKANLYVVRLSGVNDRTAAEQLRGARLLVSAESRPMLDEGEYHLADLIGLRAIDRSTGEDVGEVIGLVAGAQDLLEIRVTARDRVVMVPFVDAIVPVVDVAAGRLELEPPPGLLDL